MPLETEQPDAQAPDDDLRSTIAAALDDQRSRMPEEPAREASPEPVVETDAEKAQRTRDEQGRFAKTADGKEAAPKELAPTPASAEPAPAVTPAPVSGPPASWSVAAKAAFMKDAPTAEDIAVMKREITKREDDVAKGFAEYSPMRSLKPYVEMAAKSGTTLDKALENYIGIENALRGDPMRGFEQIMANMGIDPAAFANAYMAKRGMAPEGQQEYQAQNQRQIDPEALVARARDEAIRQFRAEADGERVNAEITAFQRDPKNVYFPNVRETMAKLVTAGLADNLSDAYSKACEMTPEITALKAASAPVDNRQAAFQARSAAKATNGAPSFGLKPSEGMNPDLSTRDTIRAAIAAQRNRA